MKKVFGVFLVTALFTNPFAFAEDRAVNINIGSRGIAVDDSALQKIRKTTARAIAEGTVDTFYVYSPRVNGPFFVEGGLSACAEAGFSSKAPKFKAFFEKLQSIHPRESTFYKVELVASCKLIEPAEPLSCGGIGGQQCPEAQQYCDFGIGLCQKADAPGICKPKPERCTDQFKPVCGCDAKTYGNACEAASAGISISHEGECGNRNQ